MMRKILAILLAAGILLLSACSVNININAPSEENDATEAPTQHQATAAAQTEAKSETQIETEAPTARAESADLDVEKEVKQIRTWYYATQDDPGQIKNKRSEIVRYVKNGVTTKIVVPQSANQIMNERWYFFHDDKLYFAFFFLKEEEHRLYFKDDVLIRYIDDMKNTKDLGDQPISCPFEEVAKEEAYRCLHDESI